MSTQLTHDSTRPALQNSFALITHHLSSLSTHLDSHRQLLTSAHAYPLPSFPGRAQEGLLGTLLRKKAEPGVEDWIEAGAAKSSSVNADDEAVARLMQLWDWAAPRAGEIAAGDVGWGLDYTLEEREGEGGVEAVRTGIARKLNAGESSDEEDGDEEDNDEDDDDEGNQVKMDLDGTTGSQKRLGVEKAATKPMMPLEDLVRFMSIGAVPRVAGMPTVGMR